MSGRDFIIELRQRYVRFEGGAGKRERERAADLERRRREHRAARNIVAPPFTADQLARRAGPPHAPGA